MNNISEINVPPSKLIVDSDNIYELPRKFRTVLNPINVEAGERPNLTGLVELQASASGVYSQKGLQKIKSVVNKDHVVIVDLRKESHGYVNGMAISWFGESNYINKDLTVDEVKVVEKANLDELIHSEQIVFDHWEGKSVYMEDPIKNPKKVQTEEEMVKEEGCAYFRLYVTDHNKATDEEIDRFVEFVKALSDEEWLHFHCRGGSGRATTFMVKFDMMRNAGAVSYDDILKRQHLIGGRDMYKLAEGTYKHEAAVERKEVIEKFYKYCQENYKSNFTASWSEWLKL